MQGFENWNFSSFFGIVFNIPRVAIIKHKHEKLSTWMYVKFVVNGVLYEPQENYHAHLIFHRKKNFQFFTLGILEKMAKKNEYKL